MKAGKVAGVQFVLNNWFIALMLFFGLAGLGVKVAGVFAAVLWHELAHAIVAVAFGYRVREIELLPFGGVARIEGIGEAGPAAEFCMAAAGPAASLALAAAIYLGMLVYPAGAAGLEFYLQVNLTLALFNLLPGLPLDGGRMLRAWLSTRWEYGRATAAVARAGRLLAAGLAAAAAAEFGRTGTINLSFIILAVFLYAAAKTETRLAGFRTMRILARKKAELSSRGVLATTHFTAVADTRVREVVRLFGPDHYHIVLVVDTCFRLRGALTETEVWEALPQRGLYARIGDFL